MFFALPVVVDVGGRGAGGTAGGTCVQGGEIQDPPTPVRVHGARLRDGHQGALLRGARSDDYWIIDVFVFVGRLLCCMILIVTVCCDPSVHPGGSRGKIVDCFLFHFRFCIFVFARTAVLSRFYICVIAVLSRFYNCVRYRPKQ